MRGLAEPRLLQVGGICCPSGRSKPLNHIAKILAILKAIIFIAEAMPGRKEYDAGEAANKPLERSGSCLEKDRFADISTEAL